MLIRENTWNGPSLHLAVEVNSVNAARLLISKGANVNAKDGSGDTPLHFAAKQNRFGIAKLLIDNGAIIEARGVGGATPLIYASKRLGGGGIFDRKRVRFKSY